MAKFLHGFEMPTIGPHNSSFTQANTQHHKKNVIQISKLGE